MYEYGRFFGNGIDWAFAYKGDVRSFDGIKDFLCCLDILGSEGWKISIKNDIGQTYIMIRDL